MNRGLAYKVGTMLLLAVLLLLALGRIDGLIAERQTLRDGVVEDIARSSSRAQVLTGPIVVVPFERTVVEWKQQEETGKRYEVRRNEAGRLTFLPETFALDGRIATESRRRGIYEARLFHARNRIDGRFQLPDRLGLGEAIADYRFGEPFLAIGVGDIRGIGSGLSLTVNGQVLRMEPGSGLPVLGNGVHARLPTIGNAPESRLDYSIELNLQGTSDFHVTPVGRDSVVKLVSNWPHPSFVGEYLPTTREVRDTGFEATWRTSFFATNLEEALRRCEGREPDCDQFLDRKFGVSFIDPVDQYLKSERAIKYALLFIGLTFAGFFLFEVMRQLRVHPIQYGLVGAALALFYLLLLSLSEHIGFGAAYASAGAATVLLIAVYVGHILRSRASGIGYGAGLAAQYGFLFVLLGAEDYALLLGSLLLFVLLAAVMLLTRRVNWFELAQTRAGR